jgi:hypothetical protein
MFRAFLVLLTLACTIAPSRADVLLGEIPTGMGGGGGGVTASSIKRVAFEFGYSIELNGAVCLVHRVGCEGMPIENAQTGAVYTFTAAKHAMVSEIAARLTNGTSEGLAFVNRFFDATGAMKSAGGNGGAPESQVFGTATDLTGNTITRITLTLDYFCTPGARVLLRRAGAALLQGRHGLARLRRSDRNARRLDELGTPEGGLSITVRQVYASSSASKPPGELARASCPFHPDRPAVRSGPCHRHRALGRTAAAAPGAWRRCLRFGALADADRRRFGR